ncbi:hypothetical protein AMK59_973 [Oryctes borbonicus]|uniref:Uncharacterized protein n=1 Tax=Oryctes borbonicus TaxID=1629725 RepID=A0A0T6BA52_9SCAR|nr:hypothetical protein AMK59_973 [Oryctes borbonicus]
MYVIFPADEVVYLSYGRLIYVPTSSTSPPIEEEQTSTHREQPPNSESNSRGFQSRGSYSSAPSTSTGSSRSFRSTASAPINTTANFETTNNKNTKLNRSTIISSRSFEILNQPERPRREKKAKKEERAEKSSLRQAFLQVPKPSLPPGKRDRRLSYWDYSQANRPERTVGTASVTSSTAVKSDGESVAANCSRYKSEYSDRKSPVAVTQYSKPEKSLLAKKKGIFGGVYRKRTPETAAKMAANDAALRELTHPHYNEHLKSHNSVAFKLVRTVCFPVFTRAGSFTNRAHVGYRRAPVPAKCGSATNRDKLWHQVNTAWQEIPQETISTLINSMPNRVIECI